MLTKCNSKRKVSFATFHTQTIFHTHLTFRISSVGERAINIYLEVNSEFLDP